MRTIFNMFIEYVTLLLLFYVLVFCLQGTWDLSSPIWDQTLTPCIGRWSLHHWTTREVPQISFLITFSPLSISVTYWNLNTAGTAGTPSKHAQPVSHVQLFATPQPVACQAPPSIGLSQQEYWSGLPFPPPGDHHAAAASSCLTLWGHMDYSPQGSSAHGIFQARILE